MEDKELFGKVFGQVLRDQRHKMGKTQEAFSELMEWDDKHLGKVERGEKTPPFALTLYNLYTKTDISVDQLLDQIQEKLNSMKQDN